jgi:hypothetical protein
MKIFVLGSTALTCFHTRPNTAAQAAGAMEARGRMGKETTGLPELLVFPGV